ncbi:endonuclease/exonuclease/phosphatase family protein [Vibrio maritimus]|uniref:endonuclease/exonuclease/phosphatase family protein n=1 Tax=Vibrio maritimus TaxID=990268 RepID=UPI003AF299F9
MRYGYLTFSLLIGISLFPTLVGATTIMTWNIEWLTTTPSKKFPTSYRTQEDFSALKTQFMQTSPDILAFQEVDSIEAISRVVGPDYDIYLSDRSLPSNKQHQFSEINQYTGFAVRHGHTVKDVADFPLSKGGRLRFASAIELTLENGTRINLLSVHLKAGCSGKYTSNKSCKTLKQQGTVLNSWLKQLESNDKSYVLLGDFNHNLAYSGDWLWATLTKDLDAVPRLATKSTKAECKVRSNRNPNKTHQFRSLIDHIVVSPDLRSSPALQNVMPTKSVLDYQMSDHCPISLTLYK